MDGNLSFFTFLLAPPLAGELILLFLLSRHRGTRMKSSGWLRVVLINLFSLLLMVSLAFLGGELYYRFVYDTTDSLSYTKVSRQWMDRYVVLNTAGFRDNIQYLVKPEAGKRRLSFVGDSFTAGHGIRSVEDRFPNIIRARHPNWEVHVIAKFGRDTGAEIEMLETIKHEGYQFDQVVLVYCLNDIADLFPDWNDTINDVFADVERGGWLRHHSFFLDTLYHRYKAAHDPILSKYYFFVKDGYQGPMWDVQKERLRKIKQFVESNGGRLLVVTFPFMQLMGEPEYEYRFVHEKLDAFWQQQAVPHLDLMNVYDGLPAAKITVSPHDAHPNEYANQLAADAIDKFLAREIKGYPGIDLSPPEP